MTTYLLVGYAHRCWLVWRINLRSSCKLSISACFCAAEIPVRLFFFAGLSLPSGRPFSVVLLSSDGAVMSVLYSSLGTLASSDLRFVPAVGDMIA